MKEVEIAVRPSVAEQEEQIKAAAAKQAKWPVDAVAHWTIRRRSIDARGKKPLIRMRVVLYKKGEKAAPEPVQMDALQDCRNKPAVLILGAGPAGYFAALELLEQGFKPVILERGKDVRTRRRDLRAIQQFGTVNPHSNYCFGEGGAGTYSDGKLYTRSKKRGKIIKVLRWFVEHGATTDILVDAHPHIGSNKLPKVVANMRETILKYGGEIHFDTYITDFILSNTPKGRKIKGLVAEDGRSFEGEAVILATGHSARDIFKLLHKKKIRIESKPFALGVRIEHPQALIDQIQYNQSQREAQLPASSYKLVCQVNQRGVFSFCMCPGGLIVPASTAPGELVVNGMSMSRRDSAFANSGMVVAVDLPDLEPFKDQDVFAGMAYQHAVEQRMFQAGDGTQKAPAQRITDFVEERLSSSLPATSYIPGIYSAPMHELLPHSIKSRLQEALQVFGKKMKGYYTEEAQIVGTESRTSSPIRVPRDAKTYMHEQVEALFPCGEGAGFAGGIVSAAMDGENVAKAVARYLNV